MVLRNMPRDENERDQFAPPENSLKIESCFPEQTMPRGDAILYTFSKPLSKVSPVLLNLLLREA